MATVKFFLKEKNAKRVTRIICIVADGVDVLIRLSTGISIPPKHWSKKNNKVLSSNPNAIVLNRQLQEFKNKVLEIYLESKSDGIIADVEYMTDRLRPKEKVVSTKQKFWSIVDDYLKYKEKRLSLSSIKKIKSLVVHLKAFERKKKITFDLDTIDRKTLELVQDYFYYQAKLNLQSTAKYLGLFKTFLNWSKSMKLTQNEDHKQFSLTHQPDILKPILSDDDLTKLFNAEYEKGYLDNARWLLILSALTGLRFSDYTKINLGQLRYDTNGNEFLTIRQTKTKERIEVPLNKDASRIVHDLISGKLRAISNQKLNKYIKEACRLAGIDDEFEVDQFVGNKKITSFKPKYELITTHTGRRTFATKLLLKGVPSATVMKFTGHKDEKSFSKYVNIPKEKEMELVRLALSS
ncbi:site-specific integrase [Flammeovirga yaeyamensis]|uniref:Site-specific integrase n=1 Tax=Flammeovirga yaeyamensis TaxID=367791 RepID=A0AAX1MZE9_9BACT|nr:tyrosine-type recombinase/integrase [Flammeovirga yaeyamensis]MBB3695968.1 site-specific recombinase XerD [Flammeovirga yaeyamensis]NMF34655.1 tyrosine-type recombinase/integrase [Flammeovirga yaeyamensis]QWG00516.1 site-specific integrase [Flammeovirga yaeyamensis]